jgi:hypothetical protein
MHLIRPAAFLAETRALFAIAWPMIIAQLAQMGTGVVDTIMAGHYSAIDLAAIAIGYNIWLPIFLLFIGMMLGATVVIAQDYGAGRLQRIRDSLPQAMWLALALGLVAGPLCYFIEPLLNLLDLDATTHTKSLDYLQAAAGSGLRPARQRRVPGSALPHPGHRCHATLRHRQRAGLCRQHSIELYAYLRPLGRTRIGRWARRAAAGRRPSACGWDRCSSPFTWRGRRNSNPTCPR